MSNEARNRLLPGYTDAAEAAKANGEKLDTLTVNSEHSLTLLDRLCTLKELQLESDTMWRDRWRKEKLVGHVKSFFIVLLSLSLVLIEVSRAGKDSLTLSTIASILKHIKEFI